MAQKPRPSFPLLSFIAPHPFFASFGNELRVGSSYGLCGVARSNLQLMASKKSQREIAFDLVEPLSTHLVDVVGSRIIWNLKRKLKKSPAMIAQV
jgi:hypothetical protein